MSQVQAFRVVLLKFKIFKRAEVGLVHLYAQLGHSATVDDFSLPFTLRLTF